MQPQVQGGASDPADSSRPDPRHAPTSTRDSGDDGMDAEPGRWPERIGRHSVRGVLGSGGMGVVLEAYDHELDRAVAIKLLRSDKTSKLARLRLLREAQAMARLSHANVVQVYDVGSLGDDVFVAMELVRGVTLAQWLRSGPRPWQDTLPVFAGAARGLAAAHAVGLVHRDFKPSNVIIADDGRVVVVDFGVAAHEGTRAPARAGDPPRGFLATPLTLTGAFVGTPLYMAPEQLGGHPSTPAADQFSFCVALFEALHGWLPFSGSTVEEIARNASAGRIVVRSDAPDIPAWLVAVVRRGLAVDPHDRFPGMDELVAALQDDPDQRRRRRRRTTILGAAAIACGTTLGWAAFAATREPPCTGGAAAVAELWNDAGRELVRTGLRAEAAEVDVVVSALDRRAEDLAAARDTACLAHHRGELSSARFDAMRGCLELRANGLADFATLVTSTPDVSLAAAREALARMPTAAWCRDDAGPAPDESAGETAIVRRALARAELMHDAGLQDQATQELQDAIARADALGNAPLRAEARLVAARKAMDRTAWHDADGLLTEATRMGIAAEADVVAAEAAARRVFVAATAYGELDGCIADAEIASGLIERAGSSARLTALLANNLGVVHGLRGEPELAATAFTDALRLAEQADDIDPIDRAGYLSNAAMHMDDAVLRDQTFARAQALLEGALGPTHTATVDLAARRATYLPDADAARRELAPHCAVLEAANPQLLTVCWCAIAVAQLDDELGRRDDAITALDAAERCIARGAADMPSFAAAKTEMIAGTRAVLQDAHTTALARLQAARTSFAPGRDRPWIALELAEIDLLEARSRFALGERARARDLLRSAIEALGRHVAGSPQPGPRRSLARAERLLVELGAADQRGGSMPSASIQR